MLRKFGGFRKSTSNWQKVFSLKTKITYYFRLGLLFPIDIGGLISVR